jgi:hypothetical protein
MPRTKVPLMPKWLVRILLIVLGAIFVLMPLHAFISTWGGTAIGPLWLWKSWKEIILVVLILPTLVWLAMNPTALRTLVKKPLIIAVVTYLLLTLLTAAVFLSKNEGEATAAGIAMNLRYLAISCLAYLVFAYGGLSEKWLDRAAWFLVCAGVTVSLVGILQVLIFPSDTLANFGYNKETTIAPTVLIDEDPNLPRAFATLRGPNDFGAYLMLPILIVIAYARRLPLWVVMTTLGLLGTALLLSSSRSAWLGLIAALVVYASYTLTKKISKLTVVAIIATLLLVGTAVFMAAQQVPVLRQAVFHSSPGDPTLTEGSTDQHIDATIDGIGRVVDRPLGCGVGCAGPASYYGNSPKISENYFVQIAEEVGILGLLLFLTIVGLVFFKLHTASQLPRLSKLLLAAGVGFVVIGQLLHVWSDDPLSITWWLLVGAVIGYNDGNTWIKSKGSLRSKT